VATISKCPQAKHSNLTCLSNSGFLSDDSAANLAHAHRLTTYGSRGRPKPERFVELSNESEDMCVAHAPSLLSGFFHTAM
jgi:hypothetical protein